MTDPAPHTHADPAPRPTGVGADEVSTTRVERFLAVLLAVFLFIGLLWVYAQPFDRTDDAFYPGEGGRPPAVVQRDDAQSALRKAQQEAQVASQTEVTAREAYRTRLDAGQPSAAEKQAYDLAQSARADAVARQAQIQAEVDRLTPAAEQAEKSALAADVRNRDDDERTTLLLRLGLVLASLVLSYALFEGLRRRRSRYLQVGMAAIAASAGLAVVMTGDYLNVRETGPVVLSLVGIALTAVAMVGYQRYLAARLPARRARRHECPFCGYPVAPEARQSHCEGCGRSVTGACTSCRAPRRVGVRYCAACGAA